MTRRNFRRLPFDRVVAVVAACVIGIGLATQAQANYSCSGTVAGVTVSPDGSVNAQVAAGTINWNTFCQLGVAFNGVSPDACKGILVTLMTAQVTGRSVVIWFNDGLTCTTHPVWTSLSGWYWGPMLQ